MENATKALLIAAAVLIVIMVIGLGLMVYSKASEAVEGAGDLSELQINQFNEKFLKYQNENASGSDVNALIKTVFNHNLVQPNADTCVELTGKVTLAKSNEVLTMPGRVAPGGRYKISCEIGNTKLVNKITISDVSNKNP